MWKIKKVIKVFREVWERGENKSWEFDQSIFCKFSSISIFYIYIYLAFENNASPCWVF